MRVWIVRNSERAKCHYHDGSPLGVACSSFFHCCYCCCCCCYCCYCCCCSLAIDTLLTFHHLLVRYMSLSYWSSLVVPRPTGKDHQWTLGKSVPGQQHEDDSSRHCKPLLYEQNARNDRISARYNLFFDVFSSPSAALYTCTVTQSLVDDIEHKQLMGTGIGTGIGNTFARDQGHVATYYDNSSGILGTANFLFLMSLILSLMSLS